MRTRIGPEPRRSVRGGLGRGAERGDIEGLSARVGAGEVDLGVKLAPLLVDQDAQLPDLHEEAGQLGPLVFQREELRLGPDHQASQGVAVAVDPVPGPPGDPEQDDAEGDGGGADAEDEACEHGRW